MLQYLLRRLLSAIPTLLLISMLIFAILALAPGDPLAEFGANPAVPAEVRENVKRALGLDQPWPIRYLAWLRSILQGEWGYSFASRVPVLELIAQRLPQTLWVVGSGYLLSVLIAVPIALLSALRPYSWFDNLATSVAFAGFSVPTFFTALLLIYLFAVRLEWFPTIYRSTLQVNDLRSFGEQLRQMVLPVSVLALYQTGETTRYLRAALLEQINQDYVRTARAKGLRERSVLLGHVLRNSLAPLVTLLALGVPGVFAGAIISESIFRVNGLGELLVTSIARRDTPVVMGLTFLFAMLVLLFNLIADLLYGLLDPRVQNAAPAS